jgi:hypothetical protein
MQRNAVITAALATVLVLPLGAPVQAASTGIQPKSAGEKAGGADATFKSLDKDGDGYISKEEAKRTPHEKAFAKLDKNGDGKLSREEHAAASGEGSSSSGASAGDDPRGAMKTY